MSTRLFDLTPEQQQAAQAFADAMRKYGAELSIDEAWLAGLIQPMVADVLAQDSRLATKATCSFAESPKAQGVAVAIAQAVVNQHTIDYGDDVSLRAYSLVQTITVVLAHYTQDKRPKHSQG